MKIVWLMMNKRSIISFQGIRNTETCDKIAAIWEREYCKIYKVTMKGKNTHINCNYNINKASKHAERILEKVKEIIIIKLICFRGKLINFISWTEKEEMRFEQSCKRYNPNKFNQCHLLIKQICSQNESFQNYDKMMLN